MNLWHGSPFDTHSAGLSQNLGDWKTQLPRIFIRACCDGRPFNLYAIYLAVVLARIKYKKETLPSFKLFSINCTVNPISK